MRVLITGASSGIGASMARYFDSLGYDLILIARNKKKLSNLKKELNGNVIIDYFDLGSTGNCYKLYNKYKDIDILVNDAGFGLLGEFSSSDLNKEIEMINLNIIALHVLCKLYIKDMLKKNKGSILNVASIAGFMPGPLMSTYYASKGYVVRLSQAIREELRSNNSNVSISILCPGPVKTNFDNVANVNFSLKGMDSDYVAKYAIDKMLSGKFMIIPGFHIRCLRVLTKILPDSIMAKLAYGSQRKKM